jgi:hypothetical protein
MGVCAYIISIYLTRKTFCEIKRHTNHLLVVVKGEGKHYGSWGIGRCVIPGSVLYIEK